MALAFFDDFFLEVFCALAGVVEADDSCSWLMSYLAGLIGFLAGVFFSIAGNVTEGGAVKKEADGMMTGP